MELSLFNVLIALYVSMRSQQIFSVCWPPADANGTQRQQLLSASADRSIILWEPEEEVCTQRPVPAESPCGICRLPCGEKDAAGSRGWNQ